MNENPLTEKQIKTLNEISKLPAEEQQGKLQQLLSTLNEEQTAFLQKGQGQCVFCGVASGAIEAKKIYEDDFVVALLDIHPATKGHALVIPKKHYVVTGQMPDSEIAHLFNVANKLSGMLFHELKPTGTNIVVNNGPGAGQRIPHVAVYVIPRYENDGLDLLWQPNEDAAKTLDKMYNQFKGKLRIEEAKVEKIVESKKELEEVEDEERIA
jgi:histidine triad (HIT) family protein